MNGSVTRYAHQNAASVAAMFLTTEAVIVITINTFLMRVLILRILFFYSEFDIVVSVSSNWGISYNRKLRHSIRRKKYLITLIDKIQTVFMVFQLKYVT